MNALSELECRYIGFNLGFTISVASKAYLRPEYGELRRRMDSALDELGATGRLPLTWGEFAPDDKAWAPPLFATFPPRASRLGAFLRVELVVGDVVHLGSGADPELVSTGRADARKVGVEDTFLQLRAAAQSIKWVGRMSKKRPRGSHARSVLLGGHSSVSPDRASHMFRDHALRAEVRTLLLRVRRALAPQPVPSPH